MFNKVTLVGRLGRDPEVRTVSTGTVANFSLATDETWLDNQGQKQTRTEWHRIVVWGKQADLCAEHLTKGRLVFVEGSLQTRKYQDSQGQERAVTEVKAQRILFLDRTVQAPQGLQKSFAELDSAGRQDLGSAKSVLDDIPF